MFPDLDNHASPSLFLFVWNPFEVAANGDDLTPRKSREKFKSEFKYWLKFIASKTRISKYLKPELIVVLSRKDRLQDGESIESWLGDSLRNLQQFFQAVIDIEKVFEVDARDPFSVEDLYSCIFHTAGKILSSGVPRVYAKCEQVRMVLSDRLRKKRMISFSAFTSVCRNLGIGSCDSELRDSELYEAIALSLNDSGDLIYLKSMKFVVVDTRWFCHKVMGNLIYYSGPGKSGCRLESAGNAEHGFLSFKHLNSLLERELMSTSNDGKYFFNRRKGRFMEPTVEGGDLVELLLGMHLACRKDVDQQDSDIFIPACLPLSDNLQSSWRQNIIDNRPVVFLGRRLKCRDSDLTFITPGIFQLLQVAFFKKIAMNACPAKNLISLIYEGVEVLVEFCSESGDDHFIDVLVRSQLDFDSTLKKVHERVIDEIILICSKPRGIPGVELVEAVVQPLCVRGPSNVEMRRKQDILIEDLHRQLEKEVQEGNPPKLNDVVHSWISTDSLLSAHDYLIDLLGEAELQKWREYYEGQVYSAAYAVGVLTEESWKEAEGSSAGGRFFKCTQSGKERELIYNKLCSVDENVRQVQRTLEELQGLHKQVVLRLQELGTFLNESEGGRLPRMLVVTTVQEGWRRVISALVPDLHQVRLELLCEHRLQPHLVKEQPGLCFATLDDGLLQRALPYANAFLKLAYVAVRATAHITVGLGSIVPDFSQVLASLADTADIPLLLQFDLPAARCESAAAQQWLFDVLSKHNCRQGAQIYKTFLLRRVRYPDSQHVAWLCNDHYSDGIPFPA